jgi:polyribonucleotide nucleotidyltransferase
MESMEIEGKYIGAIIGPRKSDSRNAEGNRDYHQYQENDMGIIRDRWYRPRKIEAALNAHQKPHLEPTVGERFYQCSGKNARLAL